MMRSRNAVMLGVTGGIACGKSEVGRILREAGVDVLDADDLVHALLRERGAEYAAVTELFGAGILDEEGEIDRKKLGELVFADALELKKLTRVLHPAVRDRWRSWRDAKRAEGAAGAVIVPLLHEIGETEGWDAIVCVSASRKSIESRLAKRGLGPEDIKRRIALQMDLDEKRKRSDITIDNDGTLSDLKDKTLEMLDGITQKVRKKND